LNLFVLELRLTARGDLYLTRGGRHPGREHDTSSASPPHTITVRFKLRDMIVCGQLMF